MSCLRREYNEIYQKKVTERKNISIVYRREARELSNNNREQRWPSRCASSLSSSPRLLLHSLSFVFSCFVFTVECTWCCLSIAWVAIDFPSLCSVGGCMMLKFRGTQDSVVALCSFFMSSPWFQPIHKSQKMPLSQFAAHLTPSECRPRCHSLEPTGPAWLSTGAAGCTVISADSLNSEEMSPSGWFQRVNHVWQTVWKHGNSAVD